MFRVFILINLMNEVRNDQGTNEVACKCMLQIIFKIKSIAP